MALAVGDCFAMFMRLRAPFVTRARVCVCVLLCGSKDLFTDRSSMMLLLIQWFCVPVAPTLWPPNAICFACSCKHCTHAVDAQRCIHPPCNARLVDFLLFRFVSINFNIVLWMSVVLKALLCIV